MTDARTELAAILRDNPDLAIDDATAAELLADVSAAVAASEPQQVTADDVGPSEAELQAAVIEWAAYQANAEPALELLHAIPNGGHRVKAVAARLKAQGVKAGVPDLCLPVPRGPYHGLYLEIKVDGNRPTEEQEWWIRRLRAQGYWVNVARSFEEVVATLEWYLSFGRRAVEVQDDG